MERAKTEVEKKVSKLIKFIQNKNKIPKDSKRELLGIVNDLQEQCQSLYSIFHDFQQDLDPKSGGGRKGKSRIASSSSDLEYYSSEEIENDVEEGRILYRRIHVAEQIHLKSKNDYIKTRDTAQENRENRETLAFLETHFKKMEDALEKGYTRSERAMKKLEEAEEDTNRVARLAKDIDSAKHWVREKKSELETLTTELECREAQESLLKEKLAKLEKKLAEEGTEKLSLTKVLNKYETRNKELEMKVKGGEVELLSLGDEKREAIRQLCILVDYQRDRYDQLKKSIIKVDLKT